MLNSLRESAGSWIVKIFLGLLVLSFAAWGIGDIFHINPDTAVAEVGETKITQSTYIESFNRDLQNLQRQMGGIVDTEQARRLGLPRQTLDRLVGQALYDEAARELGLQVGDDTIRQEILQNPAFRDTTGRFSAALFEQVLSQNGYSEQGYVAVRKAELARQQLSDAIVAGGHLPARMADDIYRHQRQRRVAEIVRLPHRAFAPPAGPDETTLAEFHRAHATRYTAPELRRLSFVVLRPEDFKAEVAVDPAEVRDAYEARLAEFSTPERREVEQILVSEADKAQAIADRLSEGGDFYAVAEAMADRDRDAVKLGELTTGTLPAAVDEVVFGLDLNKPSRPVESPFGWHILRVTAIAPGHQQSLEEASAQIEDELRLERAHDALYEFTTRIDDTLAGGATLEETARDLRLDLQKLDGVDAQGHDVAGARPEALPEIGGLLETAFESLPGDEPALKEAESGVYYMVRVDAIVPPALRPLADVREDVRKDWEADARRTAAEAKAEKLADRARGGESIETLTREEGFDSLTTAALTRGEATSQAGLGRGAVERLFALKRDDVAIGENAAGDGTVVFRLKEIVETSPASEPEGLGQLRDGLKQLLLADLLDQFRVALNDSIGVEIDQRAADSIFDHAY